MKSLIILVATLLVSNSFNLLADSIKKNQSDRASQNLSLQKEVWSAITFAHQSISEIHPAIILEKEGHFTQWHYKSLNEVQQLLSLVNNQIDAKSLIKFYFSGYQDPHLSGYWSNKKQTKSTLSKELFSGWILATKPDGFYVVYTNGENDSPPIGSKLKSCNGIEVNSFLKKHYAPFFDRRWEILLPKNKAASALTLQAGHFSLLKRPDVQFCSFIRDGITNQYPFKWYEIKAQDKAQLKENLNTRVLEPSFKPIGTGKYWVTVSDFKLRNKKKIDLFKAQINTIKSTKIIKLAIIDTRGNTGGSSTYGDKILSALVGELVVKNIRSEITRQIGKSDATFRYSKQLKEYWQSLIKKTEHNSSLNNSVKKLMVKINAAEHGKYKTFYQKSSEMVPLSSNENITLKNVKYGKVESPLNIILITDELCVSACLDFVDKIKMLTNVLHVGAETNADSSYIESMSIFKEFNSARLRVTIPVKKWNVRLREDNQPYKPDIIFPGNLKQTKFLKRWLREKIIPNLSVNSE